MIIKKLTLHNFGVYAGTNTFIFNSSKPVVLIGGMNGRGKTTFLEAILLSLYGSNSSAYKESDCDTFGNYLKSYINMNDKTGKSYVELEFSTSMNNGDEFIVKREWSKANRVQETVSVWKNGAYDDFLATNWGMYIETLLPSALSNFFFFDGEKIAELVINDADNSKIKESIKSMLGITVLEQLKKDIQKGLNKDKKYCAENDNSSDLEKLRNEKEYLETSLTKIDELIASLQNNMIENNKKLEKAKNAYLTKGGIVEEKRKEIYKEKSEVKALMLHNEDNLIEAASSELPLIMVKDLLDKIAQKSNDEHRRNILSQSINVINDLYDKYKIEREESSYIEDFLQFMKVKTCVNGDSIYSISSNCLYQISNLLSEKLSNKLKLTQETLDEQKLLRKKIDKLDNYITIDTNNEEIKRLYSKIENISKQCIEDETKLRSLQQEKTVINGKYIKTLSEYNKNVESVLQKMETTDDISRRVKYSNIILNVLNEFIIKLQSSKIKKLAETITNCYKLLANKKNLIDSIKMDANTLELTYLNNEGVIVPRSSLSAGERQLMIISVLWALAICSMKKLPVIIDTPLARLDTQHREALLKVYFPKASEQTIILSTDTEITKNAYDILKESIGNEFTLIYNEKSRSTTVHQGYFFKDVA